MDTYTVKNLLDFRYDVLFNIVELDAKESLMDALKKLSGHKILGAPVKKGSNCYAMIDYLDIVTAITTQKQESVEQVLQEPIEKYCNISGMNPITTVTIYTTLAECVRLMVENSTHRLLVVDDIDPMKLIAVVSQMDIIRWIHEHKDSYPDKTARIVVSEFMMVRPVMINMHRAVMEALTSLSVNRYTGIGVIDDNGLLVANFSIGDLRGIDIANIKNLFKMSVIQYLQTMKQSLLKEPKFITPGAVLDDVVTTMYNNHVHRVYVCKTEDDREPVGIVSTSDVMFLLNFKMTTQKNICV